MLKSGTCLLLIALNVSAAAESFRFHLLAEPHSLDPQSASSNSGNYFFHNIFRGLFRFHSRRGLIPEGAKACVRGKLKLTCTLNSAHHWSNGAPIVSEDYLRAFRRLADPGLKSPQTELLLNLKNARKILAGELPADRLGVTAVSKTVLRFDFEEEDPEFEYRLINVAAAPMPKSGIPKREGAATLVTSGPYKIKEWKPGQRIELVPNPNYGLPAAADRPDLEALIVENDSTALRLYETGRLNFLRRRSYSDIPRYKDCPEYHQFQVARFDYIGFAGPLKDNAALREALATSIDFATYKNLVDNKGLPGCPTLPARLMDRQPCLRFNAVGAKAALAKAGPLPKLEFYFSRMGGDDIAQTVEWIQGQWKKNLDVRVELNGEEQVVYLQHLRSKPPAIFRKGAGLDRPTCLAALEIFTRADPENYLRLQDDEFERLVKTLSAAKGEGERKTACRKAVERLMAGYRLIPLGEMYFSILAKVHFQGWDLNELNQLDLTDLRDSQTH